MWWLQQKEEGPLWQTGWQDEDLSVTCELSIALGLGFTL